VDQSPASAVKPAEEPVSLFAIYKVFTYIGLMSFGGGLIPWIQREIVTSRGWMKLEEFFPGVALSQVLPGVNSTNLSVFIGNRLRGLSGAAVALAGMLSAPFVVMMIAVSFYHYILDVKPIQIAMSGIAAAAIGMIMRTGVMAVQASLTNVLSVTIMVITFVAIGIFRLPLIWTVAVLVPLSIAASWPRGEKPPVSPLDKDDANG
jgi:chromate transporter